MFVDSYGRRSRKQNIRWTGLPLVFAYRAPFLYTVHYNAVQVMEIMSRTTDSTSPVGMKTFVNITGAQHLGPAVTPGAIYVSSVFDNTTEIICIKGNDSCLAGGHAADKDSLMQAVTDR
jgi:citron Rho-interacting kinase